MILALATICTIVSVVGLIISPYWGILFTLMAKPIIDVTWNCSFGGVNLLEIVGIAFPLLLLPRLSARCQSVSINNEIRWLAIGYLASYSMGSVTLALHGNHHLLGELLLRSLNGYLGFFLFACFYQDRKGFKILLLSLLIAGIFPVVMGLYQSATGIIWQQRQTVGLIRRVGLYHDGFNMRLYGFQTLAVILLYRSCFTPARKFWDLLLFAYAVGWLYVVFNLYSKAANLILVVWWITWSILRSKLHYLLWGSISLGVLWVVPGSPIRQALETLFSKEIAFSSGDLEDNRRVLAGRGFIWEQCWENWKRQDPEHKILGTGASPGTHNEFLRILFSAGLLGLIINIVVLTGTCLVLLKLIRSRGSAVDIIALMVFQMWLVDCTGLHPGLYPTYQWFVWGIIGLAIGSTQRVHKVAVTNVPNAPRWPSRIEKELVGHNFLGYES